MVIDLYVQMSWIVNDGIYDLEVPVDAMKRMIVNQNGCLAPIVNYPIATLRPTLREN